MLLKYRENNSAYDLRYSCVVNCYGARILGQGQELGDDFVPLVDHNEHRNLWKWICIGRDSDLELQPLCNRWLALMTSSFGEEGDEGRPALVAGSLTSSKRETSTPPPRL